MLRSEYEKAWQAAREEYLRTGRRSFKVLMTQVPVGVKTAARQALTSSDLDEAAQAVLRRLAHDDSVSSAVIRRAQAKCDGIPTVGEWAQLAAAGLPDREHKNAPSAPEPETAQSAQSVPDEEKAVRRVRTVEGMRQFNLPMGAIIVRDPDEPAPLIDPRYVPAKPEPLPPAGSPAEKTGDTAKALAMVKSVQQRIAEGVDPKDAAAAFKKELHAARLRVQRARRKAEAAAAKAMAEDQLLDAGETTKDATSSEVLEAAANGELWKYAAKPGDKAKALYGGKAFDHVLGEPAGKGGDYSAEQYEMFAKLKGPGFIPMAGNFFDALQHDTEPGEYLPVLQIPISGGHTLQRGWAVRQNGLTVVVEDAHPTDDGGPSEKAKKRIADALGQYGRVLSTIPEDKRAMQKGVALLDAKNPKDSHWAEVYKMPGFTSFATGGHGGTYFWAGNDVKPTTIAHEFGHNLDSQLHGKFDWVSNSDTPVLPGQPMSWGKATVGDATASGFFADKGFTPTRAGDGHPIKFGTHGVTTYGEAHVKEDFAEAVRLYLKDRREGKLGFLKPEAGQSLGTNVRFADLFPDRARILDVCFGLTTDYDTAFRKQQFEKIKLDVEKRLQAKEPSVLAADYAANYGLSTHVAGQAITEGRQAAWKKSQYDNLVEDAFTAMQAGNMPATLASHTEKANYLTVFGGGENNLLGDDDHVLAYDTAVAKYNVWKKAYDESKQMLLEDVHSAINAGNHYNFLAQNSLNVYAQYGQLSNADQNAVWADVWAAAKTKAMKTWTAAMVSALEDADQMIASTAPGPNWHWFADLIAGASSFAASLVDDALKGSEFDVTWSLDDDEIEQMKAEAVSTFIAKKQAAEAAEMTAEQKAAEAKAAAEAAAAQAAMMSIEDLPKEVGQKIRKRKAFVKYKAKQPQKVALTAANVFGNPSATNMGWWSMAASTDGGTDGPEGAVAKLNEAFKGKIVKFKASPGNSWYLPSGDVTVLGFETKTPAVGSVTHNVVRVLTGSGEEKSLNARYLASGTYVGPGLPESEAQKLADEYERKAVAEAALEHVTGVAGGSEEDPTGLQLRKFKEGTRRKGATWLKKAGKSTDPLVGALGTGGYGGDAEVAKRNLAVQIAERLNNPEAWEVFRAYAKNYGIGTGHAGVRVKTDELEVFENYTNDERRKWLYGEVAYRVKRWAGTSGDSQVGPLMMQKAVQEEFGLDTDYKARLVKSSNHYDKTNRQKIIDGVEKVYSERTGKWLRLVARAMYDNTQAQFKAEGITHVSLYRGMGVPNGEHWPTGTTVERAQLQPANSWSTSKAVAKRFKSYGGVLLAAEMPVSRILGSARTGFGCLNEYEFVVLDTEGPVEILDA